MFSYNKIIIGRSGTCNIMSHQYQSKTHQSPWFPIISTDQCDTCNHQFKCVSFCPHDVYEVQADKIVVAHPLNCIYRCSNCANICPQDAIIFPSITSSLKTIKPSLLHRIVCQDCEKRFMTDRNTELCFDCEARTS